MTEQRDVSAYLKHIIDSIETIESYLEKVDEAELKNNKLVRDGVIRQLEIIGEAVKFLPDRIRNNYSEIPWNDIAGTRDKLIHGYFSVDIDTVWLTAKMTSRLLKQKSNPSSPI